MSTLNEFILYTFQDIFNVHFERNHHVSENLIARLGLEHELEVSELLVALKGLWESK